MDIGYYPGCALHGSSNDYEQSLRACLVRLGVRLRELDEWICCGATAAHSLNSRLANALPARNLALACRDGMDELLVPCPLCSMRLHAANRALGDSATRSEIAEIVELEVDDSTRILNLIELFLRVGTEKIRDAVVAPLNGLRPACYYGCLLTRPPDLVNFDDAEDPHSMETILQMLGAQPVSWNYKTECCGAGMTMADEATVLDLSHKILTDARHHNADCLVVACPMCHVNLDMKQHDIERHHQTTHDLPVYYLSDLIGRALGLSDCELGIDRHFVTRS
jgi:heterodisulfide reductase subunit B